MCITQFGASCWRVAFSFVGGSLRATSSFFCACFVLCPHSLAHHPRRRRRQVFANLGGAAKSFGSMSKEAWQVEHIGFNIARACVGERVGQSMKDAPGPRSNSGEGGQLIDSE